MARPPPVADDRQHPLVHPGHGLCVTVLAEGVDGEEGDVATVAFRDQAVRRHRRDGRLDLQGVALARLGGANGRVLTESQRPDHGVDLARGFRVGPEVRRGDDETSAIDRNDPDPVPSPVLERVRLAQAPQRVRLAARAPHGVRAADDGEDPRLPAADRGLSNRGGSQARHAGEAAHQVVDAGLEQRLPEPELRQAWIEREARDRRELHVRLNALALPVQAGDAGLDLGTEPAIGHVDGQVEVERCIEDVPSRLQGDVAAPERQHPRAGHASGQSGDRGDQQDERREHDGDAQERPIWQESERQPRTTTLGQLRDVGDHGVEQPVGQAVDAVGGPAAKHAIHVALADHWATLPDCGRASASSTARMLRTA